MSLSEDAIPPNKTPDNLQEPRKGSTTNTVGGLH